MFPDPTETMRAEEVILQRSVLQEMAFEMDTMMDWTVFLVQQDWEGREMQQPCAKQELKEKVRGLTWD